MVMASPPPRQQSRPLEPIPMRNLSLEMGGTATGLAAPVPAATANSAAAARLMQQRPYMTSSPSANSLSSMAETAYGDANEPGSDPDEFKGTEMDGSDSGSSTAATEKDNKTSSLDRDLESGMPKAKSLAGSSDMDSQSVGEIVVPEESRRFRPGLTMFLVSHTWIVHLVLVFTFTYLMTFYLPQFYVDDEMWNTSCYWKLGGFRGFANRMKKKKTRN